MEIFRYRFIFYNRLEETRSNYSDDAGNLRVRLKSNSSAYILNLLLLIRSTVHGV